MAEQGHFPNRPYIAHDGSFHENGAQFFDAADVARPGKVAFTIAAGSANVCLVTIQVNDGAGNAIAAPVDMDVLLSDAASGAGLTVTSASGAVANDGTTGADLGTLTSKKALRVQTNATGAYKLSITDTGKTGFYVVANVGGFVSKVSRQLVSGDYG